MIQPWILLTNYHRYVDQFVQWALEELRREDGVHEALIMPGGVSVTNASRRISSRPRSLMARSPWHRHQMPAYHLTRRDGCGEGVTLVNIGVGPSNAKTITDHLAVLRPHCWLMVGHCGGLRQSQTIGDYVLAHAYLRQDGILDSLVPPDIPIPALAEIQIALQQAAARITGQAGEALKGRLRTGTVVTNDDRKLGNYAGARSEGASTSPAPSPLIWRAAPSLPRAFACGSLTARSCAFPTSRCTGKSNCPVRPMPSTSAPSASI